MGQASSSRRDASPSRESTLPEARPSGHPSGEGSFVISSFHIPYQDIPDISKPIENWLSMDSKSREKQVLHAKHCILTPYFLFSKEDENGGKVVTWLQQKQLIPKQSELLSDKHISVADCAEEAVDMILSLMNSPCFLYDVFHVVEQTKECHLLSDALNMAKNCQLIDVLLKKFSNFLPSNKLPRDDTGLIILVLLNQAMNHIQKVGDQTDAFEQLVKDNNGRCDELKLKGNGLFNAKKYNKACSYYSQAIKLRPFDAVLYGNRAQSYLSAAKYREALSDARRAICLNPSWDKGYFRYAKAYYHLGFYDKAIAINLQAQKKCSQTGELVQQAILFSKGRSCSPSSQPTSKRQRISSVEAQISPLVSDEDEGDYSDLPELIMDDSEEELDEPGPSANKDKASSTIKTSRITAIKSEDTMNCKRVQCLCSRCIPRTTLNRKLKRTSDTMHNHPGDDDDDHNHDDDCSNKYRQNNRQISKMYQGKNPSHSGAKSNEACASSSIHHHYKDHDDDECCTGCEVTRKTDKDIESTATSHGELSGIFSINHHHMYHDSDDARDFKIQGRLGNSDAQKKSKKTLIKKDLKSDDKNHLLSSLDNGSESSSSSTLNTLSSSTNVVSSNHNMCDDSDGCECESCSSSLGVQGKNKPTSSAQAGLQSNNDINNDSHSRDDYDEHECICGLCPVNGDDDDEWEDIDDDDDHSFSDMDLSDLPDLDEPSDEDDDDDDTTRLCKAIEQLNERKETNHSLDLQFAIDNQTLVTSFKEEASYPKDSSSKDLQNNSDKNTNLNEDKEIQSSKPEEKKEINDKKKDDTEKCYENDEGKELVNEESSELNDTNQVVSSLNGNNELPHKENELESAQVNNLENGKKCLEQN
ncbi:uncharacterized protein LOC116302400, partial [Actinia tenebrosa]|uniref:Uncharacterized protein LOC116302400 n=1 Tax=Actinia tenebrosa TaxID=6105 RepID=A0A6P8IL91_ACTTE